MIYKVGNCLNFNENLLIHGCNASGAFGAGVAGQIRKQYNSVYLDYIDKFNQNKIRLGDVFFINIKDKKYIANCITQQYYKKTMSDRKVHVSYDAIRSVFKKINVFCLENKIYDVALPQIGAGLAGGDWAIIEKIIDEEAKNFNPVVYVLEKKPSFKI